MKLLEWLSPANLRLGIIVVPCVAATIYLWGFSADRYVAESVVAVRQEGGAQMPVGADALSMLFGNTAATREDQFMLQAHILSMDMLRQLDERLNLREAYSSPKLDPIFRLPPNASREQFLRYYRNRTAVSVDGESGLLTIRAQAFSPEVALAISEQVVAISEQFINESSHRLARDQMAFAQQEVQNARAMLDEVASRLHAFQEKHGVLDPTAQVAANTGITTQLQAALAREETELRTLQSYLNESSPQVQAVLGRIEALRSTLDAESRRAMTNTDGVSLNVLARQYHELLAESQFLEDAYRGALTAHEAARIESMRKLKSLVPVESPVLPEAADYPRRLYTLFALLMGLTLLYGIGRLIVATIEDHQE